MNHAIGTIFSKTGTPLGFYEYNGTVDFVCTRIFNTLGELQGNWRGANEKQCDCKNPNFQDVILYTSYGKGFFWDGKICPICNCIVEGFEPENDIPGHPFKGEIS